LLTTPELQDVILIAEGYADGLATESELLDAGTIAVHGSPTRRALVFGSKYEALSSAEFAAYLATVSDAGECSEAWSHALQAVGRAASAHVASNTGAIPDTHTRHDESAVQASLLRDIVGHPFRIVSHDSSWLAWNDGTIPKIARAIYDERAFERLPILADALEDAGCDNADILTHCRGPGPHVRGCWVVDLLLGKQ
jgi:hypothetical protein